VRRAGKIVLTASAVWLGACGIGATDMGRVRSADSVLQAAALHECGPTSQLQEHAALCAVHAILVAHDAGAPLDACPQVSP
jgi:hypothetical protein